MNPSDLVDVEAEGSPVSTPPINGPPSMEAQSSSVKEDAAASGLESEAEASNSVVYSVLSSSLLALVGGAVGFFVARQQYQRKEYRSL